MLTGVVYARGSWRRWPADECAAGSDASGDPESGERLANSPSELQSRRKPCWRNGVASLPHVTDGVGVSVQASVSCGRVTGWRPLPLLKAERMFAALNLL